MSIKNIAMNKGKSKYLNSHLCQEMNSYIIGQRAKYVLWKLSLKIKVREGVKKNFALIIFFTPSIKD